MSSGRKRSLSDVADENLVALPSWYLRPVVYFLCKGEAVVYVGQSCGFRERLKSHNLNHFGKFDRVYILPVDDARKLDELESHWIKHFDPPLNTKCTERAGQKLKGRKKPRASQGFCFDDSVHGLSVSALNVMANLGVPGWRALSECSEFQLLCVKGCGTKTLEELRLALSQRGLKFSGEPDENGK